MSTKHRRKIDSRLCKNAFARLAYIVPRDILLTITDAAGWSRNSEEVAILVSLRDSKDGKAIAKSTYEKRITHRLAMKKTKRLQKKVKRKK